MILSSVGRELVRLIMKMSSDPHAFQGHRLIQLESLAMQVLSYFPKSQYLFKISGQHKTRTSKDSSLLVPIRELEERLTANMLLPPCSSDRPEEQAFHEILYKILYLTHQLQTMYGTMDASSARGLSHHVVTDFPTDVYMTDWTLLPHEPSSEVLNLDDLQWIQCDPYLQNLIRKYKTTKHSRLREEIEYSISLARLRKKKLETTCSAYPYIVTPYDSKELVSAFLMMTVLLLNQLLRVLPYSDQHGWIHQGVHETLVAISWMDLHMNQFRMLSPLVMQSRTLMHQWFPIPLDTVKVIDRCYADCLYELLQHSFVPRLVTIKGVHRMSYHVPQLIIPEFLRVLTMLMQHMVSCTTIWGTGTITKFKSLMMTTGVLLYRSLRMALDSDNLIPMIVHNTVQIKSLDPSMTDILASVLCCHTKQVLQCTSDPDVVESVSHMTSEHLDPVYLLGLAAHDMTIIAMDMEGNHQVFRVHRHMMYRQVDTLTPHYIEIHLSRVHTLSLAINLMYEHLTDPSLVQLLDILELAVQLKATRLLSTTAMFLLRPTTINHDNIDSVLLKAGLLKSYDPLLAHTLMRQCFCYALVYGSPISLTSSSSMVHALNALDSMSEGKPAVMIPSQHFSELRQVFLSS